MPAPETCGICAATALAEPLFSAYGFDDPSETFQLAACPACRTARVSPLLSGPALARYYQPSYYGKGERKFGGPIEWLTRRLQKHRAARVCRAAGLRAGKPGRVLDVGCGRANFLREMAEFGHECTGTDLDGFAFPDLPGIRFLHGAIETLALPSTPFDVVNIWHVLEHLPNPQAAIHKISQVLRPGGLLVVGVPNFGSFQRGIFGKHWFPLDLPRHLYHFDPRTLSALLGAQGFSIERVSTRTIEQDLYAFIQSFLNRWVSPHRPNRLYALLRGHRDPRTPVRDRLALLTHALIATALMPVAMIESLVAYQLGRGASIVIWAKKAGRIGD